ncbi:MAG: hypothetical protein NT003_02000 [Candidatus Magasanikbacteria bacterium]|nr:hypothetical protein [Candidatus Magasanikbacteria bacterium]
MLQTELKSLGLTDQEIQIYLAGLELGPCSILELAKKTGAHRTTVYHTVQELEQKKIFSESIRGKKRVFVAEGPDAFKKMLLTKLDRVDGIAGELLALARTGSVKPVVKMYVGLQGIKDVFYDLLRAKEPTSYAWAGIEHMNKTSTSLQEFWMHEYAPLREKHKKFAKLIMPDTDAGKLWKSTDAQKFRETRLLPSSTYNFPGEIMLYDDKVACLVYTDKEQFAVVLESKTISETLKMVFNLCWSQGY